MATRARWLNAARVAAPLVGVPVLVTWCISEQALALDDTLSAGFVGGLALVFLAFALLGLRFVLILGALGMHLDYVASLRMNLLGMFYYFFVPFAIGADLARFIKLKARDHPTVDAGAAIIIDHMAGLSALIIISTGLLFAYHPIAFTLDMSLLQGLALAGFAAFVTCLVIYRKRALFTRWRKQFDHVERILGHLGKAWWSLGIATVLSIVMHVLIATGVWMGSANWAFGLGYVEILFTVATAQIFQAVPINFGGIGATEVTATSLYLALGLPLSAAILMVSLAYVYRLATAIAGGLWDLLPERSSDETARPA